MKTPETVLSAFRNEEGFLLAAHISPDGDAVGSCLALGAALQSMGKKAIVYSRDAVPQQYRFMPGNERIISDLEDVPVSDLTLVLLDCNAPERAGLEHVAFRGSIIIDHHETEKDFGDVRWVNPGAAATGLMVYFLLKDLGATIAEEIAFNLYTAIAVDTGTFRYSNTSGEVLRVCAELVDHGVNPGLVSETLYESWERKRFALLVETLNTLEIKDGVAVAHVTNDMFKKTDTVPEDTETFSDFPRRIDEVKISALFRELKGGEWKASLRSKRDVNVARIAELFGGGGHRNAAGYKIRADLKIATEALLKAARKKD